MDSSPRRALFAISSLGLGHATRTLAIVHDYLQEGWLVTVVSTGNALALMRCELSGVENVSFIDMHDYPPLERGTGWRYYWYLVVDLWKTWRLICREHSALARIATDFDIIYSDGRYGFYSKHTPCFIITHQIAFMPPKLLKPLFFLTARFNLIGLAKFDSIIIPDFPGRDKSLGGRLSHTPYLENHKHCYIGLLSSYKPVDIEQDVAYLFVISGYLLEHKGACLEQLFWQSLNLPGKKVFVLGQQDTDYIPVNYRKREDLEFLPMVYGEARQELFARAQRVVSRSGYTTIMDLVEHDKPGILLPTPNQTEQEYLAEDLQARNHFVVMEQQEDIDLRAAAERCLSVEPFIPPWRTAEGLKRLGREVAPFLKKKFFSIVVPAHNEEFELRRCVECLMGQDYPKSHYEILIVENGSTDRTFTIARELGEQARERGFLVRLLQSHKGVSAAKNMGLDKVSPKSDWVVFCDADTRLGPRFLRQLNLSLIRAGDTPTVGTSAIGPAEGAGLYGAAWFRFYDLAHKITKTSYSLQFARADIARKVFFDTELELGEDLLFIKQCRKFGSFFFLETEQVTTSVRRFESEGYLRLSLKWTLGALVPRRIKQNWNYNVVR